MAVLDNEGLQEIVYDLEAKFEDMEARQDYLDNKIAEIATYTAELTKRIDDLVVTLNQLLVLAGG